MVLLQCNMYEYLLKFYRLPRQSQIMYFCTYTVHLDQNHFKKVHFPLSPTGNRTRDLLIQRLQCKQWSYQSHVKFTCIKNF